MTRPKVVHFNPPGDTQGSDREFEDTHVLKLLDVDMYGTMIYDPKLSESGNADIAFMISGPEGNSPFTVEMSVLNADTEVACILQRSDYNPEFNFAYSNTWNGRWGVDKEGNDTLHKDKFVDPGVYTVRLTLFENNEAVLEETYDLHVTRLGVIQIAFNNDENVRYHKSSPSDVADIAVPRPDGSVWKMEHIDFLNPDDTLVSRTEARVEQTPEGECYNDTDNIRGRTGAEHYFDASGNGAYTADLRQVNFPPRIATDDPLVPGAMATVRNGTNLRYFGIVKP